MRQIPISGKPVVDWPFYPTNIDNLDLENLVFQHLGSRVGRIRTIKQLLEKNYTMVK